MGMQVTKRILYRSSSIVWILLLLLLTACQSQYTTGSSASSAAQQKRASSATPESTESSMTIQIAPQHINPVLTPTPTPTSTVKTSPTQSATQPTITPSTSSSSTRPVLAFYYSWYSSSTWCSCHMSDLPSVQYTSSDATTIARQVTEAANAGITGFISSWWGAGDQTDSNFAKVLAYSATLASQTHAHFASSLYFESDAPALTGTTNMVTQLRYLIARYANSPYFFHWQGKPVLFFWNPLGNGRTLAQWAAIRSQVDPNQQMIWSAEGVDTSMLSVFDGIHLFSGGYWGIQNGTMTAVDQGFRSKINAYNSANGTHKIWAAGIIPGYDDTRVPGRTGTYIVPRNNGATYATGWNAAIASSPDWITITSFNEWFEGSMIEPSVTYGTQYLTLTQQYARSWHG